MVDPRAAAGCGFRGQSCRMLLSTEVRRKEHTDQQGDPSPRRESFGIRAGQHQAAHSEPK